MDSIYLIEERQNSSSLRPTSEPSILILPMTYIYSCRGVHSFVTNTTISISFFLSYKYSVPYALDMLLCSVDCLDIVYIFRVVIYINLVKRFAIYSLKDYFIAAFKRTIET